MERKILPWILLEKKINNRKFKTFALWECDDIPAVNKWELNKDVQKSDQLHQIMNILFRVILLFGHNKPASKRCLRLKVSSTSLKVFFTSFGSRAVVL